MVAGDETESIETAIPHGMPMTDWSTTTTFSVLTGSAIATAVATATRRKERQQAYQGLHFRLLLLWVRLLSAIRRHPSLPTASATSAPPNHPGPFPHHLVADIRRLSWRSGGD